ncbi:hypothetical protein TSAR_006227, partial [Trichomalopsis sarcophagae]
MFPLRCLFNESPLASHDGVLYKRECHNNYNAAARLYSERFPDRRHPTNVTIHSLTVRDRRGRLAHQRRRRKYNEDDVRVVTILAVIDLDPHVSSRQVEREVGIPRRTFLRILNRLRYHAYHITLVQELRISHMQMRIVFCRWALQTIENDPKFFYYVLFSDEAKFYSDGQLNRHNCHYWSNENPHWHRTVDHQHRWSLM